MKPESHHMGTSSICLACDILEEGEDEDGPSTEMKILCITMLRMLPCRQLRTALCSEDMSIQ